MLWLMAGVLIFSFLLSGCNEEEKEKTESPKTESQQTEIREEDTEESEETMMKVQIKDQFFTAELEKNPGAEAFAELLKEGPVTIQMNDYAGFEKSGIPGKKPSHPEPADYHTAGRYSIIQRGSDRGLLRFQFLELYQTVQDPGSYRLGKSPGKWQRRSDFFCGVTGNRSISESYR